MPYELDKLKILLVDDDSAMRNLVRDILRAFGVGQIKVASDGQEAYRKLRWYAPDMVILDWQMSPMTGLELLKHIRNDADSPNPYVPVVMLTAHTDFDRVIECRDAGATSFLAKPIAPETLYRRIVWVIEGRQFAFPAVHFGPEPPCRTCPFRGEGGCADENDPACDVWYVDRHPPPA